MSMLTRGAACLAALLMTATPAAAQGSGGGTAGGSGTGDVFGDLVHILRDAHTGQPILQAKIVELSQNGGSGLAYCPVPVDVNGAEIPLLADSCDVDPAYADRLVAVDYFGRLSGARTGERTLRMHFDETIAGIQEAEAVDLEPGGRLKVGTGCSADGACATWRVIDSPFENLALYWRLMKWGHIQTDPAEVDSSTGSDPSLGTVYHPALRAEDWAKFHGLATSLLPRSSAADCFSAETFVAACAQPQALTTEDFVRAASTLGGAADKTGHITLDLVQYLNRILTIPVATTTSPAPVNTLPALIRDANGLITPATAGLAAPADERFIDFSSAAYFRDDRFTATVPALVSAGVNLWASHPAVPLLPFLQYANGTAAQVSNTAGFVVNANDALRAIEFIHNYEIPADLFPGAPPPPAVNVAVPSVVGLLQASAAATLEAVGLGVGTITSRNDLQPAGTVLAQDPPAGTTVSYGSYIALTLSLGPGPAPLTITDITHNPPHPQLVGTAITFTAVTANAPQNPGVEYKWWVYDGSTWTVGQAWSSLSTFGWTPRSENPAYRIGVWAREAGSSTDAPDNSQAMFSTEFPIIGGSVLPLVISSFTASVMAPQAIGTPITFTATAVNGAAEFKFWLFDGTTWTAEGDWSTTNTFVWTPTTGNANARVGVWARTVGSTDDAPADPVLSTASMAYPISMPLPLTVTTILSDTLLPTHANVTITFTTMTSNAAGPLQYKYWLYDGQAWSVVQDWSSNASFAWTPSTVNLNYRIGVWVRTQGSTTDAPETESALYSMSAPIQTAS